MLERTVWALTNQLKAGDFVPEAYELRFFAGKIDRVDVCETEEQVYVKVMDYKTGSKAFDIVALYHGLQLQLMIYMDAAIEFQKKRHPEKEVVPAGVFYYRIQDPIVDKTKDKEEAESKVKTLKEALEKNDIEAIKKEKDALQETLYKLAAKVYEQAAKDNANNESNTNSGSDDHEKVEDATYEEK